MVLADSLLLFLYLFLQNSLIVLNHEYLLLLLINFSLPVSLNGTNLLILLSDMLFEIVLFIAHLFLCFSNVTNVHL